MIGAGHAGLAASRFLTDRAIDHVVIDRGEVANSWRRERWDSLRLLTPNWLSRLPGCRYDGPDPDGYMTMGEVIDFISRFASVSRAPVRSHTNVTSVKRTDDGYAVATSNGDIRCRCLVVASGACNLPSVPPLHHGVPASIEQFTPLSYRNPAQLPEGGVLVVGASATGVQLADEIHRSGRRVTLCIGEHVRLPRIYRGRDVLWWMDASGVWNQRHEEVDDLTRARGLPSPQLVGTPRADDAGSQCARRDRRRARGPVFGRARWPRAVFGRAAEHVRTRRSRKWTVCWTPSTNGRAANARDADVGKPERFEPTRVPASSRLQIDLRSGEIRSIVWATGFRPDYSWLEVPVVDEKGHLRHDGGVVDSPGMYALGLPVLRRRKSSFIHGIEDDARELIDHLAGYLAGSGARASGITG